MTLVLLSAVILLETLVFILVAIAQWIELGVNNRKVAGLWFDSKLAMGCCVIGKDSYMLIFHFGQAVYSLWWPSLTKDLQNGNPKKDSYA